MHELESDERYSFGEWVRRRKELDLTQAQLADRVGCAWTTIVKIEGDERRASREMAQQLAEYLQIPSEQRAAFVKATPGERSTVTLAAAHMYHFLSHHPLQLVSFQRTTRADCAV